MIAITNRSDGRSHRIEYVRDGQVLDVMSRAEAEELHTALSQTLKPLSTSAVTPAKAMARMRPPIMRYPAKAHQ